MIFFFFLWTIQILSQYIEKEISIGNKLNSNNSCGCEANLIDREKQPRFYISYLRNF